jgi:RHS repeat-associated protein
VTEPAQFCVALQPGAAAFLSTPFPLTPAAPTVNRSRRERSELLSVRSISAKHLLPSRARSAGRNTARGRKHHFEGLATRASTRLREVGERSETDGSSPDLGLIDMGGRVYDPLAARFTTADPIMQAPFWSQGQNRYAYVFNDPINNTDPSGFMSTAGWAGFGGFTAGVTTALACAQFGCQGLASAASNGLGAAGGGVGGGLGGLGNVAMTLMGGPFGGSSGGSYNVAAPTAAPNANPVKPGGINALGQGSQPGPSRANPESMAAGAKNAGPDPMLCQSGMFECDYEAQTMKLKTVYIPLPDGTTFVQMGQAVEAAASAVWRWLRVLPQAKRLDLFYGRLDAATPARNADEAYQLLSRTLTEVENAHSGVAAVQNPGLQYTGRMYPPMADNMTRLANGGMEALTKGQRILFGPDGSIRIFAKKTGELIFSKAGL